MQNGDIALKKIEAIPDDTGIADFITNSRYVLVRANSIDGTLVGNMLSATSGARFFNFERAVLSELRSHAMPLLPGAYLEISAGATLRENPSMALKPGLHKLSSIIRICHRKELRTSDEQLWKGRARLLGLISQFYDRMEVGLYEVTASAPVEPMQTIPISDQQAEELNKILQQQFIDAQRTSETDRDRLIEALAGLYGSVGISAPHVVIVGSPLAAAISAGLAIGLFDWNSDGKGVKSSSTESAYLLNDPIRRLFHDKPESQRLMWPENNSMDWRNGARLSRLQQDLDVLVGPSRHDWHPSIGQLEIEIEDAVYAVTKHSLDGEGTPDIDTGLGLTNYDLIKRLSEACASKLSQGNESLKELLIASVRRMSHAPFSGQLSQRDGLRDWIAKNISHLEPPPKDSDWETLNRECNSYWLHEKFCIVSQHPECIKFDQHGQVHCNDGPAIVWRDGFSQYFVNGISVTRQIVESPETLSIEQILEESNVEVRRLMIGRYGESKFLMNCGAEIIQEDEYGTLFRKELPPDEPLQMVRVINSTPEPDGTFKRYYLRVPPDITTAQAAVAWTFGLTPGEYDPSFES
jgi:hypothetical protein